MSDVRLNIPTPHEIAREMFEEGFLRLRDFNAVAEVVGKRQAALCDRIDRLEGLIAEHCADSDDERETQLYADAFQDIEPSVFAELRRLRDLIAKTAEREERYRADATRRMDDIDAASYSHAAAVLRSLLSDAPEAGREEG